MPKFLTKLISHHEAVSVPSPKGKRNVIGTIKLPHGKSFAAVREDILQKGLARDRTKEAA
jgi:hypothetical protein